MGVFKKNSGGRQTIEVRSLGLRMSSETAHPIVKIIKRDEKDIGPIGALRQ